LNRRSLTFRLVFWYSGLLLALGGGFAIFTISSFDRYVEAETRSTLSGRAQAIWTMTQGLLDDKAALADLIERRFAPEAQNRLIRISSGGEIYYQSGAPFEHAFDPTAVPIPSGRPGISRLERLGDLFLYVTSFTARDGRVVTIESGRSANLLDTAGRQLKASLIIGLPGLLALAGIGGYVLVQRALAPVQGMIEAAEAFTFNAPRKRIPLAGTEDRIDALGKTLNRMLERLDNSYQLARRFSADAAHELRTPLAIVRGELELLVVDKHLMPQMREAIENILIETVRLSQIVESLISMSRLDSVAGKATHRAVNLRELTAVTIDQIRLLADEKDITIGLLPGPDGMAAGDPDRLKQVLVNLLDNAIKYTPSGGRIEVAVDDAASLVSLEVRDTGIGIAPEHLPNIFERFYRASTDRGEAGAGLGLAIVRSICAAHGGRVEATSEIGVGSVFRVELPRAPDRLAAESDEHHRVVPKSSEAA
jgi:signal transduction histidine kinase